MKFITFTEFRRNASNIITDVEGGETFVVNRRGHPVAEIAPYSGASDRIPAWKKPRQRIAVKGLNLSAAVFDDRRERL